MAADDEPKPIDIAAAVRALEVTTLHSRVNLDFLGLDEEKLKRSQLSWEEVLPVVQRDLPTHRMSPDKYSKIREAIRKAPDRLKGAFYEAVDSWRANAWPGHRQKLIDELAKDFGSRDYTERRLRDHLENWPELRGEALVVRAGIAKLFSAGRYFEEHVGDLIELKGTQVDARAVLTAIVALRVHDHGDLVADLLAKWVGDTVWGQLMVALWADIPAARGLPNHIVEIAHLMRQLPVTSADSLDGFVLGDLSGASRAAWRRSLGAAIGDDAELKAAAGEALLWFGSNSEDLLAQFAALEINEPDPVVALKPLLDHPSRFLALRARSALDIRAKAADPMEPLLTQSELGDAVAGGTHPIPPSRTWLGDARLEQMLRTAFARAAGSLAKEVPLTASSGEENLVGKLFERIRGVCEQVTRDAAILARETDRGERLTVALSHRVIGKAEEGEEGLKKGHRFSADVTLIVRARRGSEPPFSKRATFIQAKRVRRGDAPETFHYAVNMSQMNDIAEQSSSSFLLGVGPEVAGVTMPVIPAQLMVDRFGIEVAERRVHPDMAAKLGRSLAGWLVDDVIGLWTGDSDEDAVAKASAGAGDCDTIIVEVEVALVPADPERERVKR